MTMVQEPLVTRIATVDAIASYRRAPVVAMIGPGVCSESHTSETRHSGESSGETELSKPCCLGANATPHLTCRVPCRMLSAQQQLKRCQLAARLIARGAVIPARIEDGPGDASTSRVVATNERRKLRPLRRQCHRLTDR